MSEPEQRTLLQHVADIEAEHMRCNCDLDNWEPTLRTGHSHVCRIHKLALKRWEAGAIERAANKYAGALKRLADR